MFFFISSAVPWSMVLWSVIWRREKRKKGNLCHSGVVSTHSQVVSVHMTNFLRFYWLVKDKKAQSYTISYSFSRQSIGLVVGCWRVLRSSKQISALASAANQDGGRTGKWCWLWLGEFILL